MKHPCIDFRQESHEKRKNGHLSNLETCLHVGVVADDSVSVES